LNAQKGASVSKFDFSFFYPQYPDLIAAMSEEFTSHQFILKLAQQNQRAYVAALYAYRDVNREGTPAPFMFVHREISKGLKNFPELVEKIGDVSSVDIFGSSSRCPLWRKII
jgi:hypothetical protein